MGIRHLTTFLQPYAAVKPLAGAQIVIDGPAFAYHIYFLCLKATPDARNALEAAPSYSVLVKIALLWLDGLQKIAVLQVSSTCQSIKRSNNNMQEEDLLRWLSASKKVRH